MFIAIRLPPAFKLVSCSVHPTLKMDTSVGFQRNTWRYIPEDSKVEVK
jgi:hypothetical protein